MYSKGGVGMKLKQIAKVAVPLALAALPLIALAVIPTPTVVTPGDEVTLSEVGALITRIVTFLVTFGVVIAVGVIIYGGILWMVAGGNDERAAKAKTTIWNGIKGAAVILGVGVILRTLASLITRNFFN